nr:hypothetical protein [Bernardetiaceae bacterium]
MTGRALLNLLAAGAFVSACTTRPALSPEDQKIADEANTAEWLAYGRTHSEQRFSPLADVDTATVANLKVDWWLPLPK